LERIEKFNCLDRFIARRRWRKADSLIPDHLRNGTILDLGANGRGFLDSIVFADKHKAEKGEQVSGEYDVITLLAVLEHTDEAGLDIIETTIRKNLNIGGRVIITTPTKRGNIVIKLLAKLGLINRTLANQHKRIFGIVRIVYFLINCNVYPVEHKKFDFAMNQYAVGIK